MKVLLDTNVTVDDALERYPYLDESEQVLLLVEQGQVEGYISTSTLGVHCGFGPLRINILDRSAGNSPMIFSVSVVISSRTGAKLPSRKGLTAAVVSMLSVVNRK